MVSSSRVCVLNHSAIIGIPLFVALFFLIRLHQMLHFSFYKLKIYGSPTLITAFGAVFPTALTHCLSLCPVLVTLSIFQTFSLLWYLLQWSVISDLWCYCYKKRMTDWRLKWWLAFFLAIKYFLIKVGTSF